MPAIHRSTAECHSTAEKHLRRAILAISSAIVAEDGLEWTGQLHGLKSSAEFIAERLAFYAKDAK